MYTCMYIDIYVYMITSYVYIQNKKHVYKCVCIYISTPISADILRQIYYCRCITIDVLLQQQQQQDQQLAGAWFGIALGLKDGTKCDW